VTSHFLATAAAVSLLGAGIAGAAETRSFEAMTAPAAMFGSGEGGGGGADKCRVDVVRTGAPGSADIARQDFADGSCVCTITTGPAGNNGSAESVVGALQRDRECHNGAAPAEESNGGIGAGAVAGALLGLGALAAGAAAGGSGSDSAG